MNSKTYTINEIAEQLGVHIETVRRWIRSGKLIADSSRGRETIIYPENFENFLKTQKNKKNTKIGLGLIALSIGAAALMKKNTDSKDTDLNSISGSLNYNKEENSVNLNTQNLLPMLDLLNLNYKDNFNPALKNLEEKKKEYSKMISVLEEEQLSLIEELNNIPIMLETFKTLNDEFSNKMKSEILENQTNKKQKHENNIILLKETKSLLSESNNIEIFLKNYVANKITQK